MRGDLVCGVIDLNDTAVLNRVLKAASDALRVTSNWHRLVVRSTYYFSTPDGPVPETPGWYLICDDASPLYVGEAEDLNGRLNSSNGSLDNFANSKRPYDTTRNFLKHYATVGVIGSLRVGIVAEVCVTEAVPVSPGLRKLDRCNVEKVFGLFRQRLACVVFETTKR